MKALAITGAVCCFGSFSWGMECFFTKTGGPTRGERLIRVLGLIFVACQLWQLSQTKPAGRPLEVAGFALYALAAATFWWAVAINRARPLAWAFQDAAPQHLVRSGPCRWVRHPFYTSYILAWIAGAAFAGSVVLLAMAVIMSIIYSKAAAEEERRFGEGPLAVPHADYRKATGAFFPRILPFGMSK